MHMIMLCPVCEVYRFTTNAGQAHGITFNVGTAGTRGVACYAVFYRCPTVRLDLFSPWDNTGAVRARLTVSL